MLRQSAICLMLAILSLGLFALPIRSTPPGWTIISSNGMISSLSWLHTDGRWIKDKSGGILYFVGSTESQTGWSYDTHPDWKHEADPIPMAERMAGLNVTWVRICVTYSKWSDPAIGESYKDLIDRYVQEFTARGIYVMVGNMGHEFAVDVPNNPTPWLNFITELTNRYKDNPGMCGIYIFNEPPSPPFTAETWRQWAVLGAQAVHDVNPNLLISVHGNIWSDTSSIDPYWVSNLIPVPNVVYVFHYYYWQEYYYAHRDFAKSYATGNYTLAKQQMEQSLYDRYFKYAVEYNISIMLEEFGFNGGLNPAGKGYGNEPGWPQCQYDFMDLLTKYQIPWNEYSWWVRTDTNYGLADGSDYYTLSSVGEIWAQYLN